ncbi:hypothetical protein [Massilia sp. LjRoot122]|uniref:hypothetical protein n=1 Tax=Massilia sp. LjRoot122 TaxID=3342257 RepID=UPI003ECF5EEF
MNAHKHMEAIFVVTLAVLGAGKFALDSVPQAQARPAATGALLERNIATGSTAAVVIVRAPRLPRHG